MTRRRKDDMINGVTTNGASNGFQESHVNKRQCLTNGHSQATGIAEQANDGPMKTRFRVKNNQNHNSDINSNVSKYPKQLSSSSSDTESGGSDAKSDSDKPPITIPSANSKPPKTRARHNPFKLIPCSKYGNNLEAPFKLSISVEALAIIDVHSHCVQTEVIGLLGGLYCSKYRQLNVMTAEPCESLTGYTTDLQCEMDPVSLSAASERLARDGHHIVGWYHSHPTFVPNPSLRDLETQAEFQSLFAKDQNTPFLALILNPYSSQSTSLSPSTTTTSNAHRSNLVSRYKCLMLSDQDINQGDSKTPYAFSPLLVRRDKLFYNLTKRLEELCTKIEGQPSTFCVTDKLKGKDIQYLHKISTSLKHHFETTGLSNVESGRLIDQINAILLNHLKSKPQSK
ncbi:histone H2A deubiquitinase MYSM1-like [Brevipalpus obovatus]|uniref:histone H2A deubiquitinase MYSM1-like n=1 Tax=Brevipalpus obovatus TaxID=246614 RepID=UPI003D9DEB87